MATTAATAGAGPAAGTPSVPARVAAWIKAHPQVASYVTAGVVLGAGLFWWNLLSTKRAEVEARDQLLEARAAFEAKNYPLAASELSRISENYASTRAAEEGTILLAQVRLLQGQGQQAVAVLQDFAPGADRDYRAQAYGLLGAAYENLAHPQEAAEAYATAAEAAPMDFLKAQFLSDAARAYVAAGDSARAIQAYRRIVKEFAETGLTAEAQVRLGELTKGAGAP